VEEYLRETSEGEGEHEQAYWPILLWKGLRGFLFWV
jgi:hypothetical protein